MRRQHAVNRDNNAGGAVVKRRCRWSNGREDVIALQVAAAMESSGAGGNCSRAACRGQRAERRQRAGAACSKAA